MAVNLYRTLGLKRTATKEQIRAAFKRLAMKRHSDTGGDDAAFIELKRAHDVLMDDKARENYDRYGMMPGDPDSDLTLKASQQLRVLFISLIQANAISDIVQNDLIAKMRDQIENTLKRFRDQATKCSEKIERTDELRKQLVKRLRFHGKRSHEILLAAIDEMIAQLPAQKAMAEQGVKMGERMLELIEDYSFAYDAPPRTVITTVPVMQFCTTMRGW